MMYMYFNFSHYHFLYFEEKKLIVICLFEGCYIDLILNDLDLYTDRWPGLIKSVTQSWGPDKSHWYFLLQFVLVNAHKILTFMPLVPLVV